MICFFNLENLEKESGDNPTKFLDTFETFLYKKLPSKRKGVKRIKLNLHGSSFIINPEPLITKAKKSIDIAYIIQYIKLAGKRDYSHYKYYNSKSLQLSYFPDINMQAIKTNPLLKITDTEIFFLYEENKG